MLKGQTFADFIIAQSTLSKCTNMKGIFYTTGTKKSPCNGTGINFCSLLEQLGHHIGKFRGVFYIEPAYKARFVIEDMGVF